MSVCPICQSENLPQARSCHYCGASLIDRRHRAPSRPAPALNPRPQLHHDPLADLDIATIPRTLPPAHLSGSGLSFESGLSAPSGASGALTIDEEGIGADSLDVDDFELDDGPLDAESLRPQRLGGAELTIDEAADGLALLGPQETEPDFSFTEEPIASTSARLKLSDLGGDELESRPKLYEDEPHFGDPNSLSRKRSLEQRLGDKEGALRGGTSLAVRLFSGVIGLATCVGVLWGLDVISLTSATDPLPRDLSTETEQVEPARAVVLEVKESEPTLSLPESAAASGSAVQSPAEDRPVVSEVSQAQSPKVKRRAQPKAAKRKSPPKGDFASLVKRGEKLLTQGRVSSARALFKRAQEINPSSPVPIAQLGWCELSKRRYKSAVKYFKRALSKSRHHGDSLYGLGYSYEKLSKTDEARRYFERYLKRYPRGSKARIIERKLSRL